MRRSNQYKDSGHVVTETVFGGGVEKCAFGEDSGLGDPSGELLTKHTHVSNGHSCRNVSRSFPRTSLSPSIRQVWIWPCFVVFSRSARARTRTAQSKVNPERGTGGDIESGVLGIRWPVLCEESCASMYYANRDRFSDQTERLSPKAMHARTIWVSRIEAAWNGACDWKGADSTKL
jgi:hypothetical protein